jgi:murein DD-endopeptidase MepM/ murein hydrolase activator NlpD
MPHWSGSSYCHHDGHGHSTGARMRSAALAIGRQADYALVHAGRQLRLGPIAFWIVVGTLVIMAVWTILTATYFAFREDVLTRLIARQAEMQFGYEDRIAELRAQVDRISSRQLLDQEQYEQRLEQILRRQATLESRTSVLNALPDASATGSIMKPARSAIGTEPRSAPLKPSPINDTSTFVHPPERGARLDPRSPPAGRAAGKAASGGVDGALARLQASLDRVEARQAAALNSIEENYNFKQHRMRSVLTALGVDAGKIAASGTAGGTGGPFVPARLPPDAGTFEHQVHRINIARTQVDRLMRTLSNVPIRKPVMGVIDLASGFGVRIDPFFRAPAMHTGLDIHADVGHAVRATANGTVTTAGWSGGYGKMVELDHGNCFATRYGHLSSIDVRVGQTVAVGHVLGKVGTTGRSTGPHLHYETRVDGEAVDPQKFLEAGSRLGGVN